MGTPPMLRPRETEPARPAPGQPAPVRRDPLASVTAVLLGAIALSLFVAGVLAVYTYSTPAVEVPLVVAITLAFTLVLLINIVGHAFRQLRAGRW